MANQINGINRIFEVTKRIPYEFSNTVSKEEDLEEENDLSNSDDMELSSSSSEQEFDFDYKQIIIKIFISVGEYINSDVELTVEFSPIYLGQPF